MRRVLLQRAGGILLVALIAGGLASCSGRERGRGGDAEPVVTEPVAAAPQRGGRLSYALEAEPNGLDPTRNAFDPVGIQLANALYDPAAAFDRDGVPQPYLAKAFERSADYRTWTIHLRPDVRFHDGSLLDADAALAYVNAIRRSLITGEAARYIVDARAEDADTLVLTMSRPWATFPALLTGQGGYIISPAQIRDEQGHSRPNGTGPFKLDSWARGIRFSLTRNPDYWRQGLPYLDGVNFEIVTDPETRLAGLRRGTVDVTAVSNPSEKRALDALVLAVGAEGPDRIRVEKDELAAEVSNIMLNTAAAPFDDIRARRAVAYATDVDALALAQGWTSADRAYGPFPPGSPWNADVRGPSYDLERAKKEVQGYERAHGGKLTFEIYGVVEPALIQQLTEQWRAAGINARINMIPFTEIVPRVVGGLYQATLYKYFSGVDPDVLWHFWTSETVKGVGDFSLNFTRLKDDEIDRALERGRATPDPAIRRDAYARVQERFAELVPFVWLVRHDWQVASTSRVRDARNVTLPDGAPALPFVAGTHRLTETWLTADVTR